MSAVIFSDSSGGVRTVVRAQKYTLALGFECFWKNAMMFVDRKHRQEVSGCKHSLVVYDMNTLMSRSPFGWSSRKKMTSWKKKKKRVKTYLFSVTFPSQSWLMFHASDGAPEVVIWATAWLWGYVQYPIHETIVGEEHQGLMSVAGCCLSHIWPVHHLCFASVHSFRWPPGP